MPPAGSLQRYEEQGAQLVHNDRERLESMGLELIERSLLATDQVIRHDPDLLARSVYGLLGV
jgi:hypothetical protein